MLSLFALLFLALPLGNKSAHVCISFLGLPQQNAQTVWLKRTEMYPLKVQGQKSKIKVLTGLVPLGGSERESDPCLSLSFWWLLAIFGVLYM